MSKRTLWTSAISKLSLYLLGLCFIPRGLIASQANSLAKPHLPITLLKMSDPPIQKPERLLTPTDEVL